MADNTKQNNKKQNKQLRVLVEQHLSALISAANEVQVTDKEYLDLKSTPNGFVLVYFR